MPRLVWGTVGERFFEAGVDRGVLYIDDNAGIPWNGLVSVTETSEGGESTPYFVDGIRFLNKSSGEDFGATIEAYTYPLEFIECDGSKQIKHGLFATQQKRKEFGLSYRTKIGNDIDGIDHAYKIHLIYNAKIDPSERANATLSDTVEPFNFSWKVVARPPVIRGYRPLSHFVIDSRETPVAVLATLENILYGNSENTSRLPSIDELIYIFESYNSSFFDAGTPIEPYYATFDAGAPASVNATTVDGGAP